MKKKFQYYFIAVGLLICASLIQCGCANINMTKKTRHSLLPETTSNDQTVVSPPGKAVNLSGEWAMGFRFSGVSTAGTMWLKQNGANFSGYGKDSQNGPSYKIERGVLRGNEVIFLKRYENDAGPAIQYHGQFSYLAGDNGQQPYMGGDFSREVKGSVVTGDWEAMQNQPKNVAAVKEAAPVSIPFLTPTAPSPRVESSPITSDHIPDLSGKWQMAFEYNFKVIHATVFLEQEGKKLGGHGVDHETSNRFVIRKGWYSYPRAGFVCEYVLSSKAKHPPPVHEMTFKADVTLINDKDYQGPYLSGKTQGGGSWEAERVN